MQFLILLLLFFPLEGYSDTKEAQYLVLERKAIAEIRKLEKRGKVSEAEKLDRESMAELESVLKKNFFESKFTREGKISLITLLQDGGFDQLGGLKFRDENSEFFTTDSSILGGYTSKKSWPGEFESLSLNGQLYSSIFDWNSTF